MDKRGLDWGARKKTHKEKKYVNINFTGLSWDFLPRKEWPRKKKKTHKQIFGTHPVPGQSRKPVYVHVFFFPWVDKDSTNELTRNWHSMMECVRTEFESTVSWVPRRDWKSFPTDTLSARHFFFQENIPKDSCVLQQVCSHFESCEMAHSVVLQPKLEVYCSVQAILKVEGGVQLIPRKSCKTNTVTWLGNASLFTKVLFTIFAPVNPPSQPAKWWISSWISIKRTSNRIANTQPKLRTNPPKIANKQNCEQTGVSEWWIDTSFVWTQRKNKLCNVIWLPQGRNNGASQFTISVIERAWLPDGRVLLPHCVHKIRNHYANQVFSMIGGARKRRWSKQSEKWLSEHITWKLTVTFSQPVHGWWGFSCALRGQRASTENKHTRKGLSTNMFRLNHAVSTRLVCFEQYLRL